VAFLDILVSAALVAYLASVDTQVPVVSLELLASLASLAYQV
jgi:hypothetical protein